MLTRPSQKPQWNALLTGASSWVLNFSGIIILIVEFRYYVLHRIQGPKHMGKINKTAEEWKAMLTAEQYRVTRESGTEAPFSGEYDRLQDEGRYLCVCCGEALFDSQSKFIAGCGWPSFHSELDEANIVQRPDRSHGTSRIELHDSAACLIPCASLSERCSNLL